MGGSIRILERNYFPIKKLVLREGLDSIANMAFFQQTHIESLSLPNTLKGIGRWAFVDSELKEIQLPNSIEYIDEKAFYPCKIDFSNLRLPDSLKVLELCAFPMSKVKKMYIPKSVKLVKNYYSNFTQMSDVDIVTSSMKIEMFVENPIPPRTMCLSSFDTSLDNCRVHVPIGSAVLYRDKNYYSNNLWATATIIEDIVPVSSISINCDDIIYLSDIGEQIQLTTTVLPSNATDKTVTWSSSNPAVAIVNNGKVVAVGEGTAVIFAKTRDGGFTAACTVNVKLNVHVDGLTLNKESHTFKAFGEQLQLIANVSPSNATNKRVKWNTSNASVATVEDGVVTAVSNGEAVVTATTEDGGFSAKCRVYVNVTIPVETITLDKNDLKFTRIGEEHTLTATITPSNATDKSIVWNTSNPAVATVDNGKVVAVGDGSAVILATTKDGGHTAMCQVSVVTDVPVEKITLSQTDLTFTHIGDEQTLTATVYPDNATDKTLKWTSSNPTVATVEDGKVTAVGNGEADITVAAAGSDAKAVCIVKVFVVVPVTGIELDRTTIEFENIGETILLNAQVLPEDATNKNVSWKSSDEKVAVVNRGQVVSTGFGSAVVFATTEDGDFMATCRVDVVTGISGIENDSEIEVKDGRIKVNGVPYSTLVRVYDVAGKEIFSGKVVDGNSLQTPAFERGIYILYVGKNIHKLIVE